MNNIAIFASGSGTNAENIIRFFRTHKNIRVKLILSNNPEAKVIQRAVNLGVDYFVFNRDIFNNSAIILEKLNEYNIDYIVLAGFLWLIPPYLIEAFPQGILNIHPALLPKYGGKGMYGERVHQTVVENGEKESGITIHYVNEKYDAGNIIFQSKCSIEKDDTPAMVAEKVHSLEYEHFPRIIEKTIMKLLY